MRRISKEEDDSERALMSLPSPDREALFRKLQAFELILGDELNFGPSKTDKLLSAFGALKDLDLVIVVDEDIDIRDPHDVEYALATRMEASRDLMVMPAARGHEYIRVGQNGIRAKLGIDATIPFTEKSRFARCEFEKVSVDPNMLSADPQVIRTRLGL